jgi:hypothetical protein
MSDSISIKSMKFNPFKETTTAICIAILLLLCHALIVIIVVSMDLMMV